MASPAKAAANCDPRPHEQLDHEAPAHIIMRICCVYVYVCRDGSSD